MPRRSRRPGPARVGGPETLSDDLDAAREAALRLLERSRRTRFDLTRRLRDHGYSATVIEQALDRLAGVGLVDDVEYARAWLAGRLGRRPAGARRLEQELRALGISAEDVTTARARLEEERGAADEVAVARKVIAQAERRTRGLDPRVRRRRLYELLARRGFDGDTIEQALRDEPDDDGSE
jgi:regulatory protein